MDCASTSCRYVEHHTGAPPRLQVCPLRTDSTPHFIRLDTQGLALLLVSTEEAREWFGLRGRDQLMRDGNVKRLRKELWNRFFRTHRREFQPLDLPPPVPGVHKFAFAYEVETDGEALRVLHRRDDDKGRLSRKRQPPPPREQYIDEPAAMAYAGRKVVTGDPGKKDIIYFSDDDEHMRYTADQRRKETHFKAYRDKRNGIRATTVVLDEHGQAVVPGRTTVMELEGYLRDFSSKTTDIVLFGQYVTAKNLVDHYVLRTYKERIFRRLRWYAFIGRQRSETGLVRRFHDLFGAPDEVVIGWGDWSKNGNNNMRFLAPTPGKRLRKLFRKAGYAVFLVDEYNTSGRCFHCQNDEGVTTTVLMRPSPRPWRNGELVVVHGLLMCRTCGILWNRNRLASLNQHLIATNALSNQARPQYLRRQPGAGAQ